MSRTPRGVDIIFFSVIIFAVAVFIYVAFNGTRIQSAANSPYDPSSPTQLRLSSVETTSVPQTKAPVSYAYLFEGSHEAKTSNVVGILSGGAFAWYVPDWLVSNWDMSADPAGGFVYFTPKAGRDINDFSEISFETMPATESNNAESLYQKQLAVSGSENVIIGEVLLNKLVPAELSLMIDTDTRIYHITARVYNQIDDFYYLDGNNKTLLVHFEARAEVFPQFADKIRDMVEGIGALVAPQG